jgi:hypothetical protein
MTNSGASDCGHDAERRPTRGVGISHLCAAPRERLQRKAVSASDQSRSVKALSAKSVWSDMPRLGWIRLRLGNLPELAAVSAKIDPNSRCRRSKTWEFTGKHHARATTMTDRLRRGLVHGRCPEPFQERNRASVP